MKHPRPKNLNLFTIHFPLPAIVSILHRISGVILFILIPFILLGLQFSLTDTGYETLGRWVDNIYIKFIIWSLLIPFIFHMVAGVRHLLSDIHIGDTLKMGRKMALLTFIISALLVILAGVWIW